VSRYPMVELGTVAKPIFDEVRVDIDAEYDPVGVYSFGRGLFRRARIAGSETSYKSFHRLAADQLVVSRLNAWEGALAVANEEFAGCVVSPEFPVFALDAIRVDRDYMAWLCRWPAVWDSMSGVTRGSMVRRKRINVVDILGISLPLPDIEEQVRTAGRLNALDSTTSRGQEMAGRSCSRLSALRDSILDQMIWSASATHRSMGPLNRLADVNPSTPTPPTIGEDDDVMFVPMRAVDEERGEVLSPSMLGLLPSDGGTGLSFPAMSSSPELRPACTMGSLPLCPLIRPGSRLDLRSFTSCAPRTGF
jgi:hypothetical protein